MLRNKLSKLIFGIMAAVMVLGTGVYGQASYAANSDVMAISSQVETSATVDSNGAGYEDKVVGYVSDKNISKLYIKADIPLTEKIVEAINKRTTPLEIVISEKGFLTISDNVNLDGSKSELKIVRDSSKIGVMVHTENSQSSSLVSASITGVLFDNNDADSEVFSNSSSNVEVSLNGNVLIGGGSLSSSTNFDEKVVCFDNDFYGGAVLLAGDQFETNYEVLNVGSEGVDLKGTVRLSTELGGGAVGLKTAEFQIVSGGKVIKTISSKIADDEIATLSVDGLNRGQEYTIVVSSFVDIYDNEYFLEDEELNFTTFKSSVSGLSTNSASVSLEHGSVLDSAYPLTMTVTVGQGTKAYTIDSHNIKSVSVTGLNQNTEYTYKIADKNGNTLDVQKFRTTTIQSSGSSNVSGSGSGSVISGGSSGSGSTGSTITGSGSSSVAGGTITSNDINKGTITDVTVSVPVSNSSLSSSLNNGKEFKTNLNGVTVKYSNGKIEFVGLVPGKEYKNLTVTYKDVNGNTKTVTIPTFTTKASATKSGQFVKDVYQYSLNRLPDETGFAYWGDQINSKKTSPENFVKNLLNEKEFLNAHKTTAQKIEGLYKVIVNRASDSTGLNFWTTKYNELIDKGYSESVALSIIVDQMVNENEFKTRVNGLGL